MMRRAVISASLAIAMIALFGSGTAPVGYARQSSAGPVAETGPAIYPTPAAFRLDPAYVDGPVTMTPLATAGLSPYAPPLTRTAYAVTRGRVEVYRVDVFKTAVDAKASFAYQMAHLPPGTRFTSLTYSVAPGERQYVTGGRAAIAVVFRNVEIVVLAPYNGQPNSMAGLGTIQAVGDVSSVLLSVAHAAAARAAGLVYPSPAAYLYPVSVTGPRHYWIGEGGMAGPLPHSANVYVNTRAVGDEPSGDTFEYRTQPFGTQFGAAYTVDIYGSATDAVRMHQAANKAAPSGLLPREQRVRIAQPIAPNQWLFLSTSSSPKICSVRTGVQWRNVVLQASILDRGEASRGQPLCRGEAAFVTSLLARMWATTHVGAPPPIAAPTPSSPATPATRVITFSPFTETGQPLPRLHVTTASGTCGGGSDVVLRPIAWRCSVGNNILDPCFLTNSIGLLCVPSPWDTRAIHVIPTASLPQQYANPSASPNTLPWALQLTSGDRCTLLSGATLSVGNMRLNYGCSSGATVYGDPDRRSSLWTVHLWTGKISVIPASAQLRLVSVSTAWR